MNLLIIQARMGSTRLPGKVLKHINNKPILEVLYQRIKKSKNVDKILIATTKNVEDDRISMYCNENNISHYRGSDWDVLDRFYQAAMSVKPKVKNIIRICSDNPLLSYREVDIVFNKYIEHNCDYFSNSNNSPDFLEDGFDVEVFSFESLKTAWRKANYLSEREHVCPYIKKHFRCAWQKINSQYNFKLSVDDKNDLELVRKIFDHFGQNDFGINDVVVFLNKNRDLLQINKDSKINSGYEKSIENEKKVNHKF